MIPHGRLAAAAMPPAEVVEPGSVPSARAAGPPFRREVRVVVPVPTLREGLNVDRDRLGHEVLSLGRFRGARGLPESDTELARQTRRAEFVFDLTVASLDSALESMARAGGSGSGSAFRTEVGRCAVAKDPWGNRFGLREPPAPTFPPGAR
jgi:lactoylglutathione lyase